ncbi:MAG: hypothetical protein LC715_08295 [Gammaproteobacteria bacterium]|nr:hypothetical protein [Gammaproteobacteria bacterium]
MNILSRARIALALGIALSTSPAFADDRKTTDQSSVAQSGSVQNIDKVNGSITAAAGRQYGTLETVNGSIRIEAGARAGNAETVNGSVQLAEHAQAGSLETVNGSIKLADDARAGAVATVNGSVRLGRLVRIDTVETVNGSIFADRGSRIARNVETVNGAIGLVDSDIGGNIETVNGNITVGTGSHVRGGIKVEKPSTNWMPISFGKRRPPPRIIIGPAAVVEGPLVFEREVKLYVHNSARVGPVTGAVAVRYDGARAPQN